MNRILVLLALLACSLPAQPDPEPTSVLVLASAKGPAEVASGADFQVTVKLLIAPPYHIYGLKKVSFEVPTTITVAKGGDQVSIQGEIEPDRAPKRHREGPAPYDFWEGEVTFTVPLKLGPVAAGETVSFNLEVGYMACTSEFCLPAAKLQAPFTLGVAEEVQEEAPVRLTGASAPGLVVSGSTFEATLKLDIAPGYHIYGLERVGYERPTSFAVSRGGNRVSLAGAPRPNVPASRHEDPIAPYSFWSGQVTFQVPLVLEEGGVGEEIAFALAVEFMACTEEYCLPPATLEAELRVKVGPRATGQSAGTGAERPPSAGEGSDAPEGAEVGGESSGQEGEASGGLPPIAQASFDPEKLVPGEGAHLLVPLPPGLLAAGTVVPLSRIELGSGDLSPTGTAVVEETLSGLHLRVPLFVSDEVIKEGALDIDGALDLDRAFIRFQARGDVRRSLFGFLLFAAGSALVALLTPCVFPMIPITISFFTKQGEKAHHRPVWMGTIYCLGIVGSFTALGVVFTMVLGASGASDFALHWITQLLIGLLFITFALSLFGLYEMQLPASVMGLVGRAQGRGGTLGVWLLGLLFAVTTFTCTAPFVGGLLAVAAATKEWTRPVLGMVVFSGVLAIPFFFLSAFPARLKSLPRAGGWLNEAKVCMGFIELVAAFKFLGGMDMVLHLDVFTRSSVLCAWAALFLATGLYLLGVFRLPHDAPKEKVGVVGLLLALFSIGLALYLTRGLSGEPLNRHIEAYLPREVEERTPAGRRQLLLDEMRRTLGTGSGEVFAAPSADQTGQLGYAPIYFKNDYEAARAAAIRLRKALFINFTGYA